MLERTQRHLLDNHVDVDIHLVFDTPVVLDVVLDTFAILDHQLFDILAGCLDRSTHPNCG